MLQEINCIQNVVIVQHTSDEQKWYEHKIGSSFKCTFLVKGKKIIHFKVSKGPHKGGLIAAADADIIGNR